MVKERKRKGKTSALRRQREGNSSMTPPSIESAEYSRPRKRKKAADETPRKRIMVPQMSGASASCQDRIRTKRRRKSKTTKEAEESSPLAKKKKGLMQWVLTKEPPSSLDISSASSFSPIPPNDCEEPPKRKNMKMEEERVHSQRAEFQEKYIELHQLGDGGFGSVFAGYRVEGKLPVAIKHIPKDNVVIKHKDENGRELAMEAVIMLKLRTATVPQLAMVSLLDWYDLDQELILVMERPMFAEDLLVYLKDRGGCLNEKDAKIILKQLVEAALYLQNANIFHRDIKVENILIETTAEGLQVYLIDFGLSCFDDRRKHELLCGTPEHLPLDWFMHKNYCAEPTTAWQLGVVLFEVVHMTRFNTHSFLSKKLKISKKLSKNCQDVLSKCLRVDPKDRPTLEQLLSHPWFL
ncbi:serine/threonine-protein kinase pim-2-like isoform X2 [Poecilia latipinna]|uniref:serine/threonine-protein kinase pim-2-like isoform X2 n=1 Tax=Poecilia latipinna TaxID=48699 RepID=UPI00072E900A|nr:PREDICTED: serine/threonine-protein kinase pim-2-like isoform X2 [Poecilia latipinna]